MALEKKAIVFAAGTLIFCFCAQRIEVVHAQELKAAPQKVIPSIVNAANTTNPGAKDPAAWSDAIPYYNLANKYLEKAKYEDAVDNYHEAIARYSYDPDFYVNLGYCYRQLGDYDSAEQAFRKALSLNDKDWATWSNLANALLKQKRLPETIKTLEKCLKLNPPAKEKAAMLQDIVDIKKVLANQAPPQRQAVGGSVPPFLKQNSAAETYSKQVKTQPAKTVAVPTKAKESVGQPPSSDWDYVYK